MAEHLEILRRRLRRRRRRRARLAREARALDRHLRDAVDRRRAARRRRCRAGSARGRWRGRTGGAARRARRCPWARRSPADRGCRRHGCSACSGAAACWPPSPSPAGSWNACPARRCRRCARSSPSIGSRRRLYGPMALTMPNGPPSWLAPLSDMTMISVSSSWPAVSRKATSRARCWSAWSSMAAIGRLQAREERAARRRAARPTACTPSLRGGRRVSCGTMPSRLLARQPLLALDVPAIGEQRVVLRDQVGRRLVRRVAGAERHPGQPRDLGLVGDVVGDDSGSPGRPGRRSGDSRRRRCRADRPACCRAPARARTGRSRHRGSRRSGRSRGRAASRRTARSRPISVSGVTCHLPSM